MKSVIAALTCIALLALSANAACNQGAYVSDRGDYVVVPLPDPPAPGRAGYFGGSQGGWVAPLAATRSAADFVAIGFGLVASPIEEDREQMVSEARALGLDAAALDLIDRLSAATSRLVLSDFSEGYDELAKVRRELTQRPWSRKIQGEYSGEIMRLTDDELRRLGRARRTAATKAGRQADRRLPVSRHRPRHDGVRHRP